MNGIYDPASREPWVDVNCTRCGFIGQSRIMHVCQKMVSLDEWENLQKELEDLRYEGPGSVNHRLDYLLTELENLFPDAHNPIMSDPPEPKYINAIKELLRKVENEKD
jgi:hypothetical protein